MKIFLIVLFVILVGCKKDGTVDSTPPIYLKKYTVTFVTINSSVIPNGTFTVDQGTTVNFTATAPEGLDSLYINSAKSVLTGNTYTSSFSVFNDLTIKIVGKEKIIILPTRDDTIKSAPWHFKKDDHWYADSAKWNDDFSITDSLYLKSNIYFYNEYMVGYLGDGTKFLSCKWHWTGSNSIIMGDQNCLYTLTNNLFVTYHYSGRDIDRNTYWR